MKIYSRKTSVQNAPVKDLIRARDSVIYFALNFLDLTDESTNTKLNLTAEQLQLLTTLQTTELTATKGPRQSGKSLVFAIFAAWKAIFSDKETIFVTHVSENSAWDFNRRVQALIKQSGFSSRILSHTRAGLHMVDGTRLYFVPANKLSSASKGMQINTILADEMAFFGVPAQELLDRLAFFRLTQGTKLHVISTPSTDKSCAFKSFYEAAEMTKHHGLVAATSLSNKCPIRCEPNYEQSMRAMLSSSVFDAEILGNFPD